MWTEPELRTLLEDDFELFKSYFNINSIGKWEKDDYVLYKTKTDAEFIAEHQLSASDFISKLKDWKNKLSKAKSSRNKPRLDDKVLTSWNALMIKGYIDAYRALGDETYLENAIKNANFIGLHFLNRKI